MYLKALRARVCKKLLDQWKRVGEGFFYLFFSSPPASPIPQMLTRHEFVAHGGMRVDQVKRLKELEKENARLKRLVADLSLDNAILKEANRGNF
jgi:hypothetical protein